MIGHMYGKGRLTADNIKRSLEAGSGNLWQAGLQVRVNHLDCPAGPDSKRRLYVKRPTDNINMQIAYCHNCGCSGHIKDRASRYGASMLAPSSLVNELDECNKRVILPSSYVRRNAKQIWGGKFPAHYVPACEPENWTMEALRWLIKSGITLEEMKHYEYYLDLPEARVWHPIYVQQRRSYDRTVDKDYWKERIGAQGRAVGPALRSGAAKYLTIKREDGAHLETQLSTGTGRTVETGHMLVLCEDYLSAIRLVEPLIDYTVTAVPLFGSHIRTEYLFELAKQDAWHRIIVWLDNDVDAVLAERERIAGALKMIGVAETRVDVIAEKVEPKHLSVSQLNDVLLRAHRGTLGPKGLIHV